MSVEEKKNQKQQRQFAPSVATRVLLAFRQQSLK
jgi:hypothetical protein